MRCVQYRARIKRAQHLLHKIGATDFTEDLNRLSVRYFEAINDLDTEFDAVKPGITAALVMRGDDMRQVLKGAKRDLTIS